MILTILSTFSIPFTVLYLPGFSFDLFIVLDNILHNISFTRVLLPLPETPVTHINLPSGNSTEIFFKLFSLHPVNLIDLPFPFLRFFGTSIFSLPERYLPVILLSFFITSSGVPHATK